MFFFDNIQGNRESKPMSYAVSRPGEAIPARARKATLDFWVILVWGHVDF